MPGFTNSLTFYLFFIIAIAVIAAIVYAITLSRAGKGGSGDAVKSDVTPIPDSERRNPQTHRDTSNPV
jgi:hypothetical protein